MPKGPVVFKDGKLWRPRVEEDGKVVRDVMEGAVV